VNRLLPAVVVAIALGAGLVVLGSTPDDRGAPSLIRVPTAAVVPAADDLPKVAAATHIPRRALQAYVAAAQAVAQDDPGCRLAWNTVAGIGSTESSHGTFAGARLDDAGVARPVIIGVPLDGTDGNRALADSDGGTLDGDNTWDRAVGPMQFIPTTWQVWGADGDSDGARDPHDIDDAALAAARYLCDAGGDLSRSTGWTQAVLTYNNSGAYARTIARTAAAYANAS
jgi:membrane-bound lytic murein transglycosylase B